MRHDLLTLRLLVAAAEEGSLSRAAARLTIALGAASRRLSELEARSGVLLFDRHARGLRPTAAGATALGHARAALQALGRLDEELREYARGIRGHVRVFANASAIIEFLPQDLARFLAAHPSIRVDLEERSSAEVVRAVAAGDTDVGLFEASTPALALQCLDYRADRLALVCPAGHPLARRRRTRFAAALQYDIVGLHAGTALLAAMTRAAAEAGRPLRLRIQVRSFDAMCRMIAAGIGIGVLPAGAIGPQLARLPLKAVALTDAWAERRHAIAVRDRDALERPAALFVAHLAAAAAAP